MFSLRGSVCPFLFLFFFKDLFVLSLRLCWSSLLLPGFLSSACGKQGPLLVRVWAAVGVAARGGAQA